MSEYKLRLKRDDFEVEYKDEFCWFIERQLEQIWESLLEPPAGMSMDDAGQAPKGFNAPNSHLYKIALRRGGLLIELSTDDDENFMQRQMRRWSNALIFRQAHNPDLPSPAERAAQAASQAHCNGFQAEVAQLVYN